MSLYSLKHVTKDRLCHLPKQHKQAAVIHVVAQGEVNLVCDQNLNDFAFPAAPTEQAPRSLILLKTAKEELLEVGYGGSQSDCAGRS